VHALPNEEVSQRQRRRPRHCWWAAAAAAATAARLLRLLSGDVNGGTHLHHRSPTEYVRSADTRNASASATLDSQHRSNGPAPVRRAGPSVRRPAGAQMPLVGAGSPGRPARQPGEREGVAFRPPRPSAAGGRMGGVGSGRTRAPQKTCRWLRARGWRRRHLMRNWRYRTTNADAAAAAAAAGGPGGPVLTLRERRSTSQDLMPPPPPR